MNMLHNNKLKWTLLIPAYNESLTIKKLVQDVLVFQPTELIVVNDCSSDNTAELIKEFPITIITNQKNLGKASSLWKGFNQALNNDMDIVITMDGDGQHDPNDIPKILNKYLENKDSIIIGARKRNKKTQPFARYFANKFANFWVSWAAGYRISDSQSGYRVYPISLIKKLAHIEESILKEEQGFVFESEVLIEAAWQNIYSTSIDIEAIYPEARRASHFRGYKDISNITKMVANRLFKKNMNLVGLYRILIKPPVREGRV